MTNIVRQKVQRRDGTIIEYAVEDRDTLQPLFDQKHQEEQFSILQRRVLQALRGIAD